MNRARWKKVASVGLVIAAVAFAVNAFRLAVPRVRAQSTGVAYTVILAETVFDAQGGQRPGILLTSAVRSDGSRVIRSGTDGASAREIRLASGRTVKVLERLKVKSTVAAPAVTAASLPDPASQCTKSFDGRPRSHGGVEVLGEENIAGYRAVKVKNRGETTWYALDHGCAAIRSRMEFGRGEASEKRLVALIPGEPDEALFLVPAGYQEGPPSVARPPMDAKCDASCQQGQNRWFAQMDAEYYKHRIQ
jgi:hypothetical protein